LTEFSQLGLGAPILNALNAKGYKDPTPIQVRAIPHILAGRDLLGIAATGTGKTAAFALPMLQRLASATAKPAHGGCRALVLSPTRELAAQIAESFRAYGKNLGLRTALIVGGVSAHPQKAALSRGVDILVATPGRLLDHLAQGNARLDQAGILVLDEADHMLDLGFIPAIRKLIRALPKVRQNLFFSATMPPEIATLAGEILRNPERVAVTPSATPAERIDQHVMFVDPARKPGLLADTLRTTDGRALIFTRTKRGADRVVRGLEGAGIGAAAIHGNKSQGQRERALAGFRTGRIPILVATDIAARGIDVEGINLVVNFDLPHVPETYVHRIGRTARAGAAGTAIAFCTPDERSLLRDIETLLRVRIPSRQIGAGEATHSAPRPVRIETSRGQQPGQSKRGGNRRRRRPAFPRHTEQVPA